MKERLYSASTKFKYQYDDNHLNKTSKYRVKSFYINPFFSNNHRLISEMSDRNKNFNLKTNSSLSISRNTQTRPFTALSKILNKKKAFNQGYDLISYKSKASLNSNIDKNINQDFVKQTDNIVNTNEDVKIINVMKKNLKIDKRENKILKSKIHNLIETSTLRTCLRLDNSLDNFNKKLLGSFEKYLEEHFSPDYINKHWAYFIPKSYIYKNKQTIDNMLLINLSEEQLQKIKDDMPFYFNENDIKKIKLIKYEPLVTKLNTENELNNKEKKLNKQDTSKNISKHKKTISKFVLDNQIEEDKKKEFSLEEKLLQIKSKLNEKNKKFKRLFKPELRAIHDNQVMINKHIMTLNNWNNVRNNLEIIETMTSRTKTNISSRTNKSKRSTKENIKREKYIVKDDYETSIKLKLNNKREENYQKEFKNFYINKVTYLNDRRDTKISKIKKNHIDERVENINCGKIVNRLKSIYLQTNKAK